jgi:hypothetical protein
MRFLVVAVAAVVIFVVGIALGEALHDNPKQTGTQTVVRTLTPLQVAPAARRTITITVEKQ